MKLKITLTLILFLLVNNLYSQKNKNEKEIVSEFSEFWKNFITAYTNLDHNWLFANCNNIIFEGTKGGGPFDFFEGEGRLDYLKQIKPTKKHLKKISKVDIKKIIDY